MVLCNSCSPEMSQGMPEVQLEGAATERPDLGHMLDLLLML